MFSDPRYPEWVGAAFRPSLELWWAPTLVAALLALLVVGAVLRRRPAVALGVGVVVAVATAAIVGWATRRYPPPAWVFVSSSSHPVVVVVVSEQAPRRSDYRLSFATDCAVLVHPDDIDAASSLGPWSVYPGAFPLPQTDSAEAGEAYARAFATDGSGPSPLSGAQVHGAIDRCGGDAVRALWRPSTLDVRGGDAVWLVQALDEQGEGPHPLRAIDLEGRCAVRVEGVDLGSARVRFVDDDLEGHEMGMAGLRLSDHGVAARFIALPWGTRPEKALERLKGADADWERCLRVTPEVRPAWEGP